MASALTWFAVTVVPNDPTISTDLFDGVCADLVELGAAGTAVDRAPEITCYLEGDQAKVDAFIQGLTRLGCSLRSQHQVKHENWTGACPDVWEPITAGPITVVPVESPSDNRAAPPGAIRIIPGLGFGTGHHSTTRMVLTAFAELVTRPSPLAPTSVLDFGTGSGILAIAVALLCKLHVDAIDIDQGAIENAQDNAALNHVSNLLSLSTTPIEQLRGPYDLILANVYGEVLMSQSAEVTRLASPGATAILSGITEIVWGQVWETYSGLGWVLVSEQSESGWMCAVLQYAKRS
jgi:ribosomal protein L11 methyltransferase